MSSFFYLLGVYKRFLGNRVILIFVLSFFVAILDGFGIAMIIPVLQMFDEGTKSGGGNAGFLIDFIEVLGIPPTLKGILLFIFLLFVLKGLLKFVQGIYTAHLMRNLENVIKMNLFNDYVEMNFEYFMENNTGHFVTVMNGYTGKLLRSFSTFVTIIISAVMVISYMGLAFTIAWKVAAFATALALIMNFVLTPFNKIIKKLSRSAANESSVLNKLVIQTIQSFKYIVSTGVDGVFRKTLFDSITRSTEFNFKSNRIEAFTNSVKEVFSISLVIAIIVFQMVVLNEPLAAIVAVILLFYRGTNSLLKLQTTWQQSLRLLGAVEYFVEEVDRVGGHKVPDGECELPKAFDVIGFKDVSFSYVNTSALVLDKLNFEISKNSMIALVGESGAGKTTVVDLLTGLLSPSKGLVEINGIPLTEIARSSWRKRIGYVSQDLTIFDDTIGNNISLWQGGKNQGEIVLAAKEANAHEFIEKLPEGYNTKVGDRGTKLSGGQKQRLFIARELFKKPDLLILDEATSALDSKSEKYIQNSIDDLKGKITVVIIAHRLSTIKNVDLIYVLEKGEIIESGKFSELVDDNVDSRFSKMVELQSLAEV